MSTMPDLVFRRLEDVEREFALALGVTSHNPESPRNESFGLTPDGPPAGEGEVWGLFLRGALSAAVWLEAPRGGAMRIRAAAIPKGNWHMGLLEWMLGEIAKEYRASGVGELVVRIDQGGPAVGEALSDANFTGPDPESDDYPKGEWRRRSFGVVAAPENN